jgi:hypothetical protein
MDWTKLDENSRRVIINSIKKAAAKQSIKKLAILLHDTGLQKFNGITNRKCYYFLTEPHENEEFVYCSASNASFGSGLKLYETYIFPCDINMDYEILLEMSGSTREHIDPIRCIEDLGYTVCGRKLL